MMMKNKIYYLGLLTCFMTTYGCLAKTMHWSGAAVFLILGLIILAVLFLPLALNSSYKDESDKKLKTLYLLTAIVLAVNFLSALFKIMQWPGANLLLLISIPLPFVVLLPVYLLSNTNDKEINYKNFMAMMFFFAYFAAITALLALGASRNVIDDFIKSAYSFEDKAIVLAENTKWLGSVSEKDSVSGNDRELINSKIRDETGKLCNKIDELKKMLIINGSGNASLVFKDNGYVNLLAIKFKDSKPNIEKHDIADLKNDINDFKVLLQKKCNDERILESYFDEVFDTSNNKTDGDSWENGLLNSKILVSAIERLDLLQFRVRLASFEALAATH
jgi:hypothetical protein